MYVTYWLTSLVTLFFGIISESKDEHLLSMILLAVSATAFVIPFIKNVDDNDEM